MASTINNIHKCRRISYWICKECAVGMESIEAWSRQMLKIKYMQHVALRTVGLFFWCWTPELSRAKGQLFRVNSYRFTSSQARLRLFKKKKNPSGETDINLVMYLWHATVVYNSSGMTLTPYNWSHNWLLNWLTWNGWMKTNSDGVTAPESSECDLRERWNIFVLELVPLVPVLCKILFTNVF